MEKCLFQKYGIEFQEFIPRDVFNEIAKLVGFEEKQDLKEMSDWVKDTLKNIDKSIATVHQNKLWYKRELLKHALAFSYLAHFKQTRRSIDCKTGEQEKYVVHPAYSVENFLDMHKRHDVFSQQPSVKIDVTYDLITLLLHDVIEDFFDSRIEGSQKSNEEILVLLINYIAQTFSQEIAISVVLIFTKLSKRIQSKDFKQKFSKTDLGRIDFAAQLSNIVNCSRNVGDLRLILAEKEHNLETPNAMVERKYIDFNNLKVALALARFRHYSKSLSAQIQYAYLDLGENQELKKLWQQLENKINNFILRDKFYFQTYQEELESDLNLFYKTQNQEYKLEYRPLDTMRVFETALGHYLRETKRKISDFGEDLFGGYKIIAEIIQDSRFDKILKRLFLGRVSIILSDAETQTTDFYSQCKQPKLNSFKIQPWSSRNYFLESENPDLLEQSGYKGLRFGLIPKALGSNEVKKPIETKIVSETDYIANEYGERTWSQPYLAERLNQQGEYEFDFVVREKFEVKYLGNYLESVRQEVGQNLFSVFETATSNPRGCELKETEIIEAMRAVNNAIKKLRIFPLLATGGKTHS